MFLPVLTLPGLLGRCGNLGAGLDQCRIRSGWCNSCGCANGNSGQGTRQHERKQILHDGTAFWSDKEIGAPDRKTLARISSFEGSVKRRESPAKRRTKNKAGVDPC